MKKTMSAVLTMTMVASMMTGCGSSTSTTEQVTTQEVVVVDGKEMLGNMYLEGDQIVKEPVTFNIMTQYETRQTDFKEMALFQELEEKSNVLIDWELITTTDWDQKKNLKLASGTYPDAFFSGIDDQDVSKYAPQGILIQLDDLIEQYAPNIQKIFEKYPEYEASCRGVDGNIYSLSTIVVDPGAYNPDQLFINKTWLDNLGFDVPTTMDEFYTVLEAFKNDDPNGNGKADEIPFSARFDDYIQSYHSLFGAYGRVDLGGRGIYSHFILEDGELVFTADKEEYKTAIIELHKFFEAGLFDKEIFTQDVKQYFAKGKTEEMTLGAFVLWNRGNMVGAERIDDYVAVAPLKGPNGDQVWTKEVSGNTPSTAFAITNQCENPEILIRWIDQFFEEKLSVNAAWGPTVSGENGIDTFVASENTDQSFDDYRYQQAPIWGPLAVYEDYYDRVVEMPSMMIEKVEIMDENYAEFMTNESLPPLKFTDEETDWFSNNASDVNNHISDYQARWLLEGGIEEEWDTYLAGLEKLNIEKHVEYMQAAYERYSN